MLKLLLKGRDLGGRYGEEVKGRAAGSEREEVKGENGRRCRGGRQAKERKGGKSRGCEKKGQVGHGCGMSDVAGENAGLKNKYAPCGEGLGMTWSSQYIEGMSCQTKIPK